MPITPEAFATPDDMQQRSLGAITATSHPFLAKELAAATETIRRECGWHIATRQQVTRRQVRPWLEAVWLPAMEIASIDAVTVDGVVLDVGTVRFDPDTGWTNIRGTDVEVTYTAGFESVPADLVQLTLELAAGGLGSPLGISREQAGGVSVTLTRASGALTGADEDRIAPYRIGYVP
ncbi:MULTISPECIES: hypothetical protein [unclassified Microbacterium]|uniref:hypothetical protein n=1 Tax=Microbacterium TaxID=33882 RepID=UPI003BA121D4